MMIFQKLKRQPRSQQWKRLGICALSMLLLAGTSLQAVQARSSASSTFQEQQNAFGLELFQRLYRQDSERNLFISPTSIYLALLMLYNGAEGQTRQEMERVLQLNAQMPAAELQRAAQAWLKQLNSSERGRVLEVANAIWVRQGFQVRPDYLQSMQTYFQAEVHEAPFNHASLQEINAWVKRKTHDKIPKILENLEPDLAMLLLNAIYFKGDWQVAFDKKQTRQQSFRLASGEEKQIPLMQRLDSFDYLETPEMQAVRLPYKDKATDMIVFLPKPEQSLNDLMAKLTPAQWQTWQSQMHSQKGVVMLPRFKMKYSQNLNQTLKAMGMPSAFGNANFSRMAQRPLQVSYVLHKSFVDVNEEGTEAAAVTAIGMRVTSVDPNRPFVFRADRPFVFAIVDRQRQDILFLGTLVSPPEAQKG